MKTVDTSANDPLPSTIGPALEEDTGLLVAKRPPLENTASTLFRGTEVGRYVILDKAGAGGMGVVYSAYDPVLDRKVALKFVRYQAHGSSGSAGAETRLLREAQALAKLSHPNIVTIFDVGTFGEGVFLAMEFLMGQTLRRWLTQTERGWEEIVDVMLDAGQGLAAAHAAGLVHRDVKPSNILVTDDSRVVVMDFGLVQARVSDQDQEPWSAAPTALDSQLTEQGEVMGTPSYMSPEQHRGEETGPASDQFGFCVTLYETLYGVRPFDAPTLTALRRVVYEGTIQPAARTPGPRKLLEAVRRGLAVDPDRRHPSMEALLATLSGLRRRRRRVWAVGAAAGLASVLGAGATWAGLANTDTELCAAAEQKLVGVWDDAMRARVTAAFLGTKKQYAKDALDRVHPRLDGYAKEWAQMHRDACEATSVRGEQSAEVLDLRMACLFRAKTSLAATAGVLASADAKVVQRAHKVVAGLEPLERCADIEALRSFVEPPPPSERETVDAVVAGLAEVSAKSAGGRYDEATRALERVEALADTVSYLPVQTGIALHRGHMHSKRGEYELAETAFQAAVASAIRWGQWEELRKAATRALRIIAEFRSDPERALTLRSLAEGLAAKDGSSEARSYFHGALAGLFHAQGKYPESEAEYRRSIELRQESASPDELKLALLWNGLGLTLEDQGKHLESEAEFRRVIELQKRVLGPEHPAVPIAQINLADSLQNQGKLEAAAVELRDAIELSERSLGPDHPTVGGARGNLGTTLRKLGQYGAAEAQHRRALAIYTAAVGTDHPSVAISHHDLGHTLLAQGKLGVAESEMRRACEGFERTLGLEHPSTAGGLHGLATVLLLRNHPTGALEYAERAWAIGRKQDANPSHAAKTAFLLAQILTAADQDPRRAKTLAESAASRYRGLGSAATEELAEVETWLAAHG